MNLLTRKFVISVVESFKIAYWTPVVVNNSGWYLVRCLVESIAVVNKNGQTKSNLTKAKP